MTESESESRCDSERKSVTVPILFKIIMAIMVPYMIQAGDVAVPVKVKVDVKVKGKGPNHSKSLRSSWQLITYMIQARDIDVPAGKPAPRFRILDAVACSTTFQSERGLVFSPSFLCF